jgi:hypothetical protein
MAFRFLAAAGLVAAAAPFAFGQWTYPYSPPYDGFNFFDGYYVWQDVDFAGGGENEADGWGVKGRFAFVESFFATGEYQRTSFDSNADLNSWRAGAGFAFAAGDRFLPYLQVQYITYELDVDTPGAGELDTDGGGVHLGAHFPVTDRWRLFGEVGYLRLDDADGWEASAGTAVRLTGVDRATRFGFGLFADYRYTDLDVDTDITGVGSSVFEIHQIRVGGRLEF